MDDNRDIMMLLAMRDSILHTFFQILWEKARSHRTLNNVRIPDTVVFSHSRVADWYFTSKDGIIRKKGHMKLSSANVIEQLAKRSAKNKSSVAAVVLERDPSREDGLKTRHMDINSVRNFLGEGGGSGTLQSFVEPKAESGAVHNNEIVLNWTPNVFYVEKKKNLYDMAKDSKVPLDERTTVEETAKNVNVAPLVSTRVTAELEAVCQEIALHIEAISKPSVRLASIGLHAKLDANDQLWIMFCSSIRIISVDPPSRVMSISLVGRADKTQQSVKHGSFSESPRRVAQGHGRSSSFSRLTQGRSAVSESPDVSNVRQGIDFDATASSSDGESLVSADNARRVGQRASSRSLLRARRKQSPSPRFDAQPLRASNDDDRPLMVSSAHEDERTAACVVCANELDNPEVARVVPRRHVIFPLSIIAFFHSHPCGSRYVDVVGSSKQPQAVPEFIHLMDPAMTLEEFNAVRRDEMWLSEPLLLCDECAEGLRDVVASLQIERDGSIVVPRTQKVAPPASSAATSSRDAGKPPRLNPIGHPPRAASSAS